MPDDLDFRSLFGPVEANAPKIDTKKVIRRARARRIPAQLAVAGGVVVGAGVLVTGVIVGLRGLSTTSETSSASVAQAPDAAVPSTTRIPVVGGAASGAAGTDTGDKRAPAEELNLCGDTLAEIAPSATGLVLTPHFPDADAGAASVKGTVTLTNTSSTRFTGTTATAPSVTLSQHGIVLWHSHTTDTAARMIDLAPGESTEYAATFVPVTCGVVDDTDGFRTDLPHVAAGEYQVSAAMEVPAAEPSDLVTGPTQTVTLK